MISPSSGCHANTQRFVTETNPIPSISFSTKLSDAVEFIDIDYDTLGGYMCDRGYTDEEIASTTITFENKVLITDDNKKEIRHIAGEYVTKTQGIAIYPRHDLHHYGEEIAKSTDKSELLQHLERTRNERTFSQELSETVAHELEHRIIDLTGGMKAECQKNADTHRIRTFSKWLLVIGAAYISKDAGLEAGNITLNSTEAILLDSAISAALAPFILRSVKKTRRRIYDSDPEEKICFEVGANAPNDLVAIRIK